MNLIGNTKASLFIWLAFGAILFSGLAATAYVYETVDLFLKQGIVARAKTIASSLNPEEIDALTGNAADVANPVYQNLKARMVDIHAANQDSRFVYLMGRKYDGTVFFYVDSENPSSPDYSPPGETYGEASPLVQSLFDTKKATIEVASDRWGSWVSGLAPVMSSKTGQVVAVAGIDIDTRSYVPTLAAYASVPFSATVIILLVLSMAYRRRIEEERRTRARAEILAIASHEIRAPLTGIRWAAESILSNTESLPEEIKKKMESVYESSLLIIERISNLLTANSLEQKSGVPLDSRVLLRQEVEKAINMIALVADEKSITVVVSPTFSSTAAIQGNLERIQTLFSNLISNAVKYADPHTEIEIGFAETEKTYEMTISNTGEGILPADLPHIFSGYYRGSNTAAKTEGTGMGLFLVSKIVEMHKGTIRAESQNKKTTFIVTFPKA